MFSLTRTTRERFLMKRKLKSGTFCKTKIAIFERPGDEVRKNGACSRISIRKFMWMAFFTNKSFVSRSDFREVNPVVRLVQKSGSVGSLRSNGFEAFFRIEIWTSVIMDGDVQLINVSTLVCGVQDGYLNLLQQ